ncbi:hypothetical protein H6F76_00595 [Leptolyngbya sp. FACHB-321]|uniref:hypothetical protein n=1 Tax=Leptolyngbya sp. FACHB-321 TaxID=2692807 RepID=UPI0016891CC8|nr:hypothetical protein [Leptolyngbya sp. FACHB-321]MBD2033564.1 hypothetical protein [Leptolyngbya sp. FACHB-321]
MTIAQSTTCFRYIQDWSDHFLRLFPHRFDFIWAEHSSPSAEVEWKTESRHPLSDRLIQQGAYLFGVRFGAETSYCLLDVDTGSAYHPNNDPFALSRIVAALEPLGLVSPVACTSSYSGGLHLYFPFQYPQSSWQLAIALACLLENAGFKLQPGQLEVFPNPKPYSTDNVPSLFNAHRLPLQAGSYLLNEAFEPIWSDTCTFTSQWQLAQQRNDLASRTLKQILKQAKRKHFGVSGKAEKFVNDLNAEIELGWTGSGQTNRLLGRITMRAYIFHHVLSGGAPLVGTALVSEIVETAQALPGYSEWCRHQHEITHRAEEWAHCIEGSHYFHFGDQLKKPKPDFQDPVLTAAIEQAPSWNQRRAAATRDLIRRAIATLLEQNALPVRPTARFQALLKFGIGGASLYRHRDLWHPSHFGLDSNQTVADVFTVPVENPPDPPSSKTDSQLDCFDEASNWLSPPSLLSDNDGNKPSGKALSDLCTMLTSVVDSNHSVEPDVYQVIAEAQQVVRDAQPLSLNDSGQQEPFQAVARSARAQQLKAEAANQRQRTRMQAFLNSGDPILVAEALAWIQVNPGVLEVSQLQLDLLTKHQSEATFIERSVLLAAVESQRQRLTWSEQQVVHDLQQRFGKSSLATLSDLELQHWLKLLKQTPIDQRRRTVD